MLNVFKWIAVILLGLISWITLAILLSHLAYDFVSFLAASITNSCAFKMPVSCGFFEWDRKLQIATYLSYSFAFILISISVFLLLEKAKSTFIKRVSSVAFIASFPAYTKWGVASNCNGFGPCTTGYHKEVIAPIIVTIGFESIISVVLAIAILWIYIRRREIEI